MSLSYVQTKGGQNSAGSPLVLTPTSSIVAGRMIVLCEFAISPDGAGGWPTLSGPSFSAISTTGGTFNVVNGFGIRIYRGFAVSTVTSLTLTPVGPSDTILAALLEFNDTLGIADIAGYHAATTSLTTGSVAAIANSILVGVSLNDSDTLVAGSGFTSRYGIDSDDAYGYGFSVETKAISAATAATWTSGGGANENSGIGGSVGVAFSPFDPTLIRSGRMGMGLSMGIG